MSITADPNVATFPGGEPPMPSQPQESGSLLSKFQRTRQQLAEEGPRETVKDVPAWKGRLRIIYRYPEGGADVVIRAMERATEQRRRDDGKRDHILNANCDLLINCCHDIEFRDPDTDEWGPLLPDRRARFTARLAQEMQLDLPDGMRKPQRFILRNLFSPKAAATGEYDGDVALLDQAGEVLKWLKDADEQIDEDLRGE